MLLRCSTLPWMRLRSKPSRRWRNASELISCLSSYIFWLLLESNSWLYWSVCNNEYMCFCLCASSATCAHYMYKVHFLIKVFASVPALLIVYFALLCNNVFSFSVCFGVLHVILYCFSPPVPWSYILMFQSFRSTQNRSEIIIVQN